MLNTALNSHQKELFLVVLRKKNKDGKRNQIMFLHSCVHVLTENNERFLISKKILHLSTDLRSIHTILGESLV